MDQRELVEKVATKFDIDAAAAASTVDVYLAQMGQATGEQIDRDDISDDDADFLMEAFDAGSDDAMEDQTLGDLAEISQRLAKAQFDAEDMADRRNDIVMKLLSRGVPVQRIADIAGLTRARVYAIRDSRR